MDVALAGPDPLVAESPARDPADGLREFLLIPGPSDLLEAWILCYLVVFVDGVIVGLDVAPGRHLVALG